MGAAALGDPRLFARSYWLEHSPLRGHPLQTERGPGFLIGNWPKAPSQIRETQPFFGIAIKPPISAAVPAPESHPVFRYVVPRAGLSYVFAESGCRIRDRIKGRGIGGRIRTFSDFKFCHRDTWKNRQAQGTPGNKVPADLVGIHVS